MSITFDELRRKLDNFPKEIEEAAIRIYKSDTPVGNSGVLKESVKAVGGGGKAGYVDIAATASYAQLAHDGNHAALFPDYYGNYASIHNPTWSAFSSPRYGRDGRRLWVNTKKTRPNHYPEQVVKDLNSYSWNSLFWEGPQEG